MAYPRLLYAVREYGPYVADQARRNRDPNIPTLATRPPKPGEREEELKHQFSPSGIPKVSLKEGE